MSFSRRTTVATIIAAVLCAGIAWSLGVFFLSPYPQKGPPFVSGVVAQMNESTFVIRTKDGKEYVLAHDGRTQFRYKKNNVPTVHVGDGVVVAVEPTSEYPLARVVRIITDVGQ